MTDLIKTLTVLAILVILLRRRIYLGTVMGVGALLLAAGLVPFYFAR